jgi:hypothetical protein
MTSIGENEIPSEVPLIERLRRVPKDARLIYEHSPTCSSITPVGLLSHEAADKLESLSEALNDGVATLMAVRATAGSDDWSGSAKHFHDLCGETVKRMNAALTSQEKDGD